MLINRIIIFLCIYYKLIFLYYNFWMFLEDIDICIWSFKKEYSCKYMQCYFVLLNYWCRNSQIVERYIIYVCVYMYMYIYFSCFILRIEFLFFYWLFRVIFYFWYVTLSLRGIAFRFIFLFLFIVGFVVKLLRLYCIFWCKINGINYVNQFIKWIYMLYQVNEFFVFIFQVRVFQLLL